MVLTFVTEAESWRYWRAFGALAVALDIYGRLHPTFPDRFDAG